MTGGFSSYHPLTCFLYYVGAGAFVMLDLHPVFLLFGLAFLVLLNVVQDRGKGLRRWGAGFVLLFLFFVIINPIINHRGTHMLFYFNDNPIMLEAIIKGVTLALSLLCLLVLFVSYNLVITADKFLFLFAKIVPQWALLAMLAMRFVPLLRRRLKEIELVQQTKGLSVTIGSFRNRARSGIQFVQILLTWSLEEALQTADSMKARGYGTRERSRYSPYRMQLKDWIAFAYMAVTGWISLVGWHLGYGVLSINPDFEPIFLHGAEWLYLFGFVAFIGFPVAIEGGEKLRWIVYWKWKI